MSAVTRWQAKFSWLLGLTKTTKSSTSGGVCSEEVFRKLARSESMRAEQSGQSCRILLVYGTNAQGGIVPMDRDLAMKTIAVLSTSLRATDSIGWYQQGRMLGILLTALRPEAVGEGCDNLTTRVLDGLRSALTFTGGCSIQVRLLEQGELTALGSMQDVARET
jgi:hypothetical protein